MNRKERRIAEKKQAQQTGMKSVRASASAKAETLKAQGMALKAANKDAEAVPFLIEALKNDPSLADAHFTLAILARTKPELKLDIESINRNVRDKNSLRTSYIVILNILKNKKQYREALICQEELCRLAPDDLDEKANLALLYNLYDQKIPALRIMATLMQEAPDQKKYKGMFINMCGSITLTRTESLLKTALQTCFKNIYETNLYRAYPLWIRLVMTDPGCIELNAAMNCLSDEDFNNWISRTPVHSLNFIHQDVFLDGLRLIIITDITVETFLSRMRRWICLNAQKLTEEDHLKIFEGFICALGEQCFLNEYIYNLTIEEEKSLETIKQAIKDNHISEETRRLYYAIASCYNALYEAFPESQSELHVLAKGHSRFSDLITVQFDNPIEERRLKEKIPAFGMLKNEISNKVREQYEEHPYPRWISMINFPTPHDDLPFEEQHRNKKYRILVAGCGTGRQAISAAAIFPNSQITAIDLSRTSLAYAQRKANESGLADRINFIHADILSMKDWDGQFDIIECSGVLHHMEDPFLGWQTLNDLLIPGGHFKIGLYSETARKHIVEARQFVQERGYPSTDEGIRECRRDILNLPNDNTMKRKTVSALDFFSTSLLRDLIFHVQEHRMTLPQIEDMMQKLGLQPTVFNIASSECLLTYERLFPEDHRHSHIQSWHEFEQKYPDTFVGMYQFWCQKKS